ncbi:hypothetical protein BAE44_0010484 [Dichanthelium oligosanthes]|uniref:Uncharacterized protein n=1 Tax=Dichanthelium oligosanthes TaxID=888268 RepID=A0A1E5VTP9_9POAL|nr:hypothetical protein BAE44_0010484 [Dichanthelium oligosanthes]
MMGVRVYPLPLSTGADREDRDHLPRIHKSRRMWWVRTVAVLDSGEPLYSVVITSVSGLDPVTDLGGSAAPRWNRSSTSPSASPRGAP